MPPVRVLSHSGQLGNFLIPLTARQYTRQIGLCSSDLSIF